MVVLHQDLLVEGRSHCYIQARILYEFINLIWALRVLIPIDNLNHPLKKKNVDD
jgi:hypothetical protein